MLIQRLQPPFLAPRRARGGPTRRLSLAGALSFALHAALLAGLILWFRHKPPQGDLPDSVGSVELVMMEQQGAGTTTTPPEPAPASPEPPPQPQTSQTPETTETAETPPPPDTATTEEELPLPPVPPPNPPPAVVRQAMPTVQRPQQAPRINLGGGNNSETNAIAYGSHVIPASLDARFHNLEPVYPSEAARRGQQGAVILLIHVSADGLASHVDIAQSSGFPVLDSAARDAVAKWHFLPAVQDGRPLPFDMPFRVVFHLE
jgi:periplasmic protein TonB